MARCDLRKYLNTEFLDTFTKEEQRSIVATNIENADNSDWDTKSGKNTKDKIFLLSINEAKTYFKNRLDRTAKHNGKPEWWWLRTPGMYNSCAARVDDEGCIDCRGRAVDDWFGQGVRPAMFLKYPFL